MSLIMVTTGMNNEATSPCGVSQTSKRGPAFYLLPALHPFPSNTCTKVCVWHSSDCCLLLKGRGRKEEERNEVSEIGEDRGWGRSTQKENKIISLGCPVQSLKEILKMKLESTLKHKQPIQRDGESPSCDPFLLLYLVPLAQAFAPNFAAPSRAGTLKLQPKQMMCDMFKTTQLGICARIEAVFPLETHGFSLDVRSRAKISLLKI